MPDARWRLAQFRSLAAGSLHVFGLDGATGTSPARMDELDVTDAPVLDPMAALSLVDPDDHALAIAAVGRVMETGDATEQLHMADGTWATLHLFDLRETHELIAGVVVASRQIDRPREGRAPVPVRVGRCALDSQGRVIRSSESYQRLFGYTGDLERSPDSILPQVHPDDHQRNLVTWAAMLAAPGEPHRARYRRRRADDQWMWCETTIVNRLDDPEDPRVEAEIVDISAEMSAHEEVRARERMLQRLADGLPDGVLQLDAEGQVVYANSRAVHLLGADATPMRLVERTVDADRPVLLAALRAAIDAGEDRTVEVHVRPPSADGLRSAAIGRSAVYQVAFRSVVDEPDGRSPARADGVGVFGAICCIADITQEAERRSELEARATFDQLTATYNRNATVQALEAALGAVGDGRGVAVVFVDLDRFKPVNDRHGHTVGDRLLQAVAARLRHVVRSDDVVGRLGGDEFLVVCPDLSTPTTVAEVADRIDRSLSEPVILGELTLVPRASLGLAWTFDHDSGADELIARADAAMYDAKRARQTAQRPDRLRA